MLIFPIYRLIVADYYHKRADIVLESFGSSQYRIDENVREPNASLTGNERIWFVTTGSRNSQLNTQVFNTFHESYDAKSLTRFHGYEVHLFIKRGLMRGPEE